MIANENKNLKRKYNLFTNKNYKIDKVGEAAVVVRVAVAAEVVVVFLPLRSVHECIYIV